MMEGENTEVLKSPEKTQAVNFEDLHGNMNIPPEQGIEKEINGLQEDPETDPEKKEMKCGDVGKEESQNEKEKDENIGKDNSLNEQETDRIETKMAENEDMEGVAKDIIMKAIDGAVGQVQADSEAIQESEETPEKGEEKKEEDEWLDILGNGKLQKKIITDGEGLDSRPTREQQAIINYEAKLEDGTVVETKNGLEFVVSDQDVVPAIDLSVNLMQKGEKAIVQCDPIYAYGEEGKPPKIPPNSHLTYEIELVDIQPGPYSNDTSIEKRLEWADKKRQKGNEYYSKKDYANAAFMYTRCLKVLEGAWFEDHTDDTKKHINGLRLKCYNNLAASEMKLEKWKEALRASTAAEKLEPENVKALFRKGKIQVMLGELDKGTDSLMKASRLEPDNKVIAAELAKQKRRLEQQKEAQKKMYRRMMGTKPGQAPSQPANRSWWTPSVGRVLAGTAAIGVVLLGIYAAQKLQ